MALTLLCNLLSLLLVADKWLLYRTNCFFCGVLTLEVEEKQLGERSFSCMSPFLQNVIIFYILNIGLKFTSVNDIAKAQRKPN